MICNECETVAHCTKHGCVPKQDNSNYRYDPPVAEPVAWCSQCGHKCPQAVNQEPAGWWDAKLGFFEEKHFDQLRPLYTTPPAAQRQWVGLDNSERLNIWEKAMIEDNGKNASLQNQPFVHFARAIEAKLKEKNNG